MTEQFGSAWTRKHDNPATPLFTSVPVTAFPASLEDVIELCAGRAPNDRLMAAGSHWALSQAAISDRTFVETHAPTTAVQAMGRTLTDVVLNCLSPAFYNELLRQHPQPFDREHSGENTGLYPVHFETGKCVFQLYSELDLDGPDNPQSQAAGKLALKLDADGNNSYLGPWAIPTLGGAGGQTVFGALTTGTHGGDRMMPPIAGAVMAMHLVTDGGRHYWIEPATPRKSVGVQLTDDAALKTLYGQDRFRGNQPTGSDNFEIIRDDTIFNAVVIGAGRFGIVYSIVIGAVRQFTLHEERRLHDWEVIKGDVNNLASSLYDRRFLQIAVCLTSHDNFTRHLVGVTKRWNVPMFPKAGSTTVPAGRDGRRGPVVIPFDPLIGAPRYAFAGHSHPYKPDLTHPGATLPADFLEVACANANFLVGVLTEVAQEVEDFIASNGVVIGVTIAGVVALGGGAALLALLPWLAILLAILLAIIAALAAAAPSQPRLGQTLNDVKDSLLDSPDPAQRAAGLFVWQMIGFKLFSDQQKDQDYAAISYAVMDGHDYLDQSCDVNVDSIEVFFDASDPMLVAFVDALLVFELAQEVTAGKAMVGYISLRFTGPSEALIAMEQHSTTCAIEVAGLKDVVGTQELIDFAVTLALDPNFHAVLHWGQRNPSNQAQVQHRFGDSVANPTGRLHDWRLALSQLTANGRLDGFSSAFTRNAGLEVVTPQIASLSMVGGSPASQPILVSWDCRDNPPGTFVALTVTAPSGAHSGFSSLPLAGNRWVPNSGTGTYHATLTAGLTFNGESRTTTSSANLIVS
ncbi:MAG TPA: hypothetical protein VKF16_00990 [Candidatus Dormibacteraeota bacterium]|nr:hypothetical protein [Candidatus Dormibacteraeota bacterium]